MTIISCNYFCWKRLYYFFPCIVFGAFTFLSYKGDVKEYLYSDIMEKISDHIAIITEYLVPRSSQELTSIRDHGDLKGFILATILLSGCFFNFMIAAICICRDVSLARKNLVYSSKKQIIAATIISTMLVYRPISFSHLTYATNYYDSSGFYFFREGCVFFISYYNSTIVISNLVLAISRR